MKPATPRSTPSPPTSCLHALALGLIGVLSCGGRIDSGPGDSSGSAGDPAGSSGTLPRSFSPTTTAVTKARCAANIGDLDPYENWGQMKARAFGSWLYCRQTGSESASFESVQLDPAQGQWYRLLDDGAGGLVQEIGGPLECNAPDHPSDDAPCHYFDTYEGDTLHGARVLLPTFHTGPRSMELVNMPQDAKGYFVAIDP